MAQRIAIIAAGLLLLNLSAAALAETVRLSNGEWSPWVSQTLPQHGPASQAIREAFATQGWQVEFGFFPWSRSFELAKSGEFDGSVGWSRLVERERHFWFSEPIFQSYDVLFHRRDLPFEWHGQLGELTGYTLGRTLSYGYGQAFEEFARPPTAKVDMAPTDLLNFNKLLNGRIQLFPLDWLVGVNLLAAEMATAEAEKIVCHPLPLRTANYHVIFSKKSPQAETALAALNKGLAILNDNGRLAEIFAHVEPQSDGHAPTLPCLPHRVK